jgi:hypothetical protein
MRRCIKERNIFYNDLTKQENEFSTTITFSSSPIEKTEEELKEEIANKIVRDEILQYQDRVNYGDKEKDTNLQNQKSNEFQQVQMLRASYYDIRPLEYFLQHMFLIEDNRRPSFAVAIPAKAKDCFNLVEYQTYNNMMDVINKLSYNIIPNPHVNISNSGKINFEYYCISNSKIRSFNMLTSNDIELLIPSMQIELSTDHFKSYYRYKNMSNAQT